MEGLGTRLVSVDDIIFVFVSSAVGDFLSNFVMFSEQLFLCF